MNLFFERDLRLSRRQFFGKTANGLGVVALASLLQSEAQAQQKATGTGPQPGIPHFLPKAKQVIVLWQGGAPSQVDLFDHKPGLAAHRLEELPESIRKTSRLATMTSGQKQFPVLPAIKDFKQYGKSGTWMSELLPNIGSMADDICLVKSMHTEAVNHAPGVTFFLT